MAHPILIISLLSGIVPLVSAIALRSFLTWEVKLFVIYLIVNLLADVLMAFLALSHINNLWLTHFFILFEYSFFVGLFASWQQNGILKLTLRISIPLFVISGVVSTFLLQSMHEFNTITRPTSSFVIMALSAFTLIGLDTAKEEAFFRQSRFWIAAGALLYFAGSLAVVCLSNVILSWPAERARLLFELHAVLNLTANMFYAAGYLCLMPRRKLGAQ